MTNLVALAQSENVERWRELFHTYNEIVNAPPISFAIEGFLQEEGTTLIGGLAGHGKTLGMLAIVRALLEGGKLFDYFPVTRIAEKVFYLIPEAALGPFSSRLGMFDLLQHVKSGRLFIRTLSAPGQLPLNDHRLLEAVRGADVFLDTVTRFTKGDENDAQDQRQFAEMLFNLQRAGARTIVGAHHSPKSFETADFITLENVLRGSGDLGAMLSCCWGIRQLDSSANSIFIQNAKARDFEACQPLIVRGRPSLDESGHFALTHSPGSAGKLADHLGARGGRPAMANKKQQTESALQLQNEGMPIRSIAEKLGVSAGTVSNRLQKARTK